MSDPLAVLQRIRESRTSKQVRPGECCDMCTEQISDQHRHVVDLNARSLMCTCTGCYLLFTSEGSGGGHYRSVPDRYLAFPSFSFSADQWESLQIPVSIAFFFVNSSLGRLAAFYPGPAGATESELSIETWSAIAEKDPALGSIQPDVEAFLVRAGRDGGIECFLVPIDCCYELVGRLRRLWRGFDGGSEAHQAIEAFFDRIRAMAR